MRQIRSVSVVALCIALGSCQTIQQAENNPKQTGGMVLGAALGGLIGSQFGSGAGKAVATALGVVAGGWLGSEIGKSLDKADKAAIEQQSAKALADARDGETISWRNPESGVQAEITPTQTRQESRKVAVLRKRNVAPIPALDLIGEPYVARKSANVRGAPNTTAPITSNLAAGEAFEAVGKVQGKNWIVVAKDRRTVGYVYAPLVQKASATNSITKSAPTNSLRHAAKLDDLQNDKAIDLDAEGLVGQEIVATAECRTMNVEIANKAGESEENTYQACKAADGAWEIL